MQKDPHFFKGENNEVAFVFSAPGCHERDAGRPAAAVTGRNLAKLFTILIERGLKLPPLEKCTITNAWANVEFKNETGRAEAKISEIMQEPELDRLSREISGIEKFIFCFGRRAGAAVTKLLEQNRLHNNCEVVITKHLSSRGINSIKTDLFGEKILSSSEAMHYGDSRPKKVIQRENTNRRLQVVAECIVNQIEAEKNI